MELHVVLGAQWGDEGKGKLVDILADRSALCCRCQGGNNAGHTIVQNGVMYDFHLLPSGCLHEQCINVIGNGVVVHAGQLIQEMLKLEGKGVSLTEGRLWISDRAHLVLDLHQLLDALNDRAQSIGTTRKGIGPCYSSKANRLGVRLHHLMEAWKAVDNGQDWEKTSLVTRIRSLFERDTAGRLNEVQERGYSLDQELEFLKNDARKLRPYICDTIVNLNATIQKLTKARSQSNINGTAVSNKDRNLILIEGANALMLDLDFGTYPFVTSSSCSVGGSLTGLGLSLAPFLNREIQVEISGVLKAYTTRVGSGPFPTELPDELGAHLQKKGHEFGTTTMRPRRCGWLDLQQMRYSCLVNGYTALCVSKLDVLDGLDTVKIGVGYRLNGELITGMPSSVEELAQVQVEYKEMPGWKKTEGCRRWEELPKEAQEYILFVENELKVPVRWIGVGADREAMIEKPRV